MKNYGWNAEDYAQHSAAQQDGARRLIARLHLQGHENILDLGCGDGKVTAEIRLDYSEPTVYLDPLKIVKKPGPASGP